MVQFDNQFRQIKLKVVYYGPALGGKTTCLQYIHRVMDPQRRTKLYALNTASDRTLFFDLLGLDLGRVRGYQLLVQLYTVPGQVHYNATRRAVLAGADGVVFVADAQRSQLTANRESLAGMAENLRANGLNPDEIPLVIMYNKQDLPDLLTAGALEDALNPRRAPSFPSVATTGTGVLTAFAAIAEATVAAVADRLGVPAQGEAAQRLLDHVRSMLQPLGAAESAAVPESEVVVRRAGAETPLDPDQLMGEAVQANVAMTELNVRLDRLAAALEQRLRQLRAINEFGVLMSAAREPEEVTTGFLERLLGELDVTAGSLMLLDDQGNLVEVLRRGLAGDPLMVPDGDGMPAAREVLGSRRSRLIRLDETTPQTVAASPWLAAMAGLGLAAGMAVPLVAQDRALGVVTCYALPGRGGFEEEDLEFTSALAGNAATALANARSWRSLERINRSLEETVAARTRELESSLGRAQGLAVQLEARNRELEAANQQLRSVEQLKGTLLNHIAHELNTPVTSIQTAIRILARYQELPAEKTQRFMEIIAHESGRLAELIGSALQAAVLRGAEGEPHRVPVPVTDLLRRVLTPLRPEANERRLNVQVRVASGLDAVSGDAEQLEAALSALVRNAIEFNRDKGNVTVIVRPVQRDGRALVEWRVEDTGAGMPPEELAQAGTLFWQGGNVMTGKPRGLGLGLAVARQVAVLHGGELQLQSVVGEGTTATLVMAAK